MSDNNEIDTTSCATIKTIQHGFKSFVYVTRAQASNKQQTLYIKVYPSRNTIGTASSCSMVVAESRGSMVVNRAAAAAA
jgi:hypothetical protein